MMLLSGFCLGLFCKNYYIENASQPVSWKSRPILINCAGDLIDEKRIIEALDYWSKHGEEIYFYEYEPLTSICLLENKNLDGFIVITGEDDYYKIEDTALASTKRISRLTMIKSACIVFKQENFNLPLLLEHELGHAFGYSHKRRIGNIMHPYYDMMGDKFL